MSIDKLVPALKHLYRRARSYIKNIAFGRSNSDVFDKIYKTKAWGHSSNTEIYSGLGTYDSSVPEYVDYILRFVAENDGRTVVDIGCGDFAIGQQYAGAVESYIGVDVSSLVVSHNNSRYANEKIKFICADASRQALPKADLCIIRQVLQHLDNDSIRRVLQHSRGHKFVLVTEHLPSARHLKKPNLNKRPGPDTRLSFDSGVYIDLPPFNFVGETVLELPVEAFESHPGRVHEDYTFTKWLEDGDGTISFTTDHS